MEQTGLKFIDLFAGLGGFHQALVSLGHECVFACELDPVLTKLYKTNFGIDPSLDIRDVVIQAIPDHDILCAGFPCTSFSKAGRQDGLECPQNGRLIDNVISIIEAKKPSYFMLENVPNLVKHNGGKTWADIKSRLERDYEVDFAQRSPHQFGIPQVRERLFIVGARRHDVGLGMFSFPLPTNETPNIKKKLDKKPKDAKLIPQYLVDCIEVWQEFIQAFPKDEELPSFPIWAMEFGADYPLDGLPPLKRTVKAMREFKGSFGAPLSDCKQRADLRELLPHYAYDELEFPDWKKDFIRQNRALYVKHKVWIDPWLPRLAKFPHSLQKLEWNCKGEKRDIWKYVLQVRASGLRVKRPTTAPSLIAMTTTQVPIIAWEKRYMTPRECARLQSMEAIELPTVPTRAYKALGNAVNVQLVRMIAERLIETPGSIPFEDQPCLAAVR